MDRAQDEWFPPWFDGQFEKLVVHKNLGFTSLEKPPNLPNCTFSRKFAHLSPNWACYAQNQCFIFSKYVSINSKLSFEYRCMFLLLYFYLWKPHVWPALTRDLWEVSHTLKAHEPLCKCWEQNPYSFFFSNLIYKYAKLGAIMRKFYSW
jgi:hypothetical protein